MLKFSAFYSNKKHKSFIRNNVQVLPIFQTDKYIFLNTAIWVKVKCPFWPLFSLQTKNLLFGSLTTRSSLASHFCIKRFSPGKVDLQNIRLYGWMLQCVMVQFIFHLQYQPSASRWLDKQMLPFVTVRQTISKDHKCTVLWIVQCTWKSYIYSSV